VYKVSEMEQRLRNCHLNLIFQVLLLANFYFSVQNMILTCINEWYGEFVQNWLNQTYEEIWIATVYPPCLNKEGVSF
jgi:hypothetical protein